jgi:hypothetical protein
MLTLDLTNDPRWVELAPGVRVQLRPLTTALMVATRKDPAVAALPEPAFEAVEPLPAEELAMPVPSSAFLAAEDVSEEERALIFAKALARRAILDWEGVGDADGNAVDPSPAHIDALLDIWPVFEAFQLRYVSKGLLLEQEKNGSAPLPSGSSAGASDTAKPAHPARASGSPAKTARRSKTGRLGGQIRVLPGAVTGWDFSAALHMAEALGVPPMAAAELLPVVEAVMVSKINEQMNQQ